MSFLVITFDSGKSEQHICGAAGNCISERADYVYSYKHAKDIKWVWTNDWKFCDPDKPKPAIVCPECWKKAQEEITTTTTTTTN